MKYVEWNVYKNMLLDSDENKIKAGNRTQFSHRLLCRCLTTRLLRWQFISTSASSPRVRPTTRQILLHNLEKFVWNMWNEMFAKIYWRVNYVYAIVCTLSTNRKKSWSMHTLKKHFSRKKWKVISSKFLLLYDLIHIYIDNLLYF